MDFDKWIRNLNNTLIIFFLIIGCISWNNCDNKVQQEKIYKVGIFSNVGGFTNIADGFKTKMTQLGYVEGKNICYDSQKFSTDSTVVRRTIQDFINDKVDLIFSFTTEPALAAKAATQGTDIPIVFALAGIEGNNLVESIPKPGGNITGVRFPGPESTVKRLEILHELAPHARRIYIIYDPNYPTSTNTLSLLRPAISSMNLQLVEDRITSLEELQACLLARAALSNTGIDAILIMPELITQTPDGFRAIRKFAQEHNIPIGGAMAHNADWGAIFSFVPDNVEMGMQAANLADKIFKGTPAGSIMVVTPDSYLRLNYKVIQELGLTVSEGLLSRAKEIIR